MVDTERSDAKTDIRAVDDQRILTKIASMPVSEWSYTAQGTAVRQLGPMAQDFHAAFGLGEDDRHISTVDEEGVALAAIKALQAEVAAKDRQLDEIRRSDQARDDRIAILERRLVSIEALKTAGARQLSRQQFETSRRVASWLPDVDV